MYNIGVTRHQVAIRWMSKNSGVCVCGTFWFGNGVGLGILS